MVQTSALVSATQALVETSALVHIDCTVAQALVETIALGSIGGAPPPVPGCLLLEELRFEEAPADGFTLVALGCCPRSVVELGVTRLRERKSSMSTNLSKSVKPSSLRAANLQASSRTCCS